MNKSHDQGARDFTPVDRNLLADGYPTEELSADGNIARDWATYTSLNPMDADILNRGTTKQVKKPTAGPVGPSEAMHTDKSDDF
jgi:hypothetical protein